MAYVRTVTFTLSKDEANELVPGSDAYNAIVGARKYLAQSMQGLIQSNVWQSAITGGRVRFVVFNEWNSLEDLQNYADHPAIKKLEELLNSDVDPLNVAVYEVVG
jgi:heme-degrading monooxygenase HmoA